jgi:cystathionine beta-lyase
MIQTPVYGPILHAAQGSGVQAQSARLTREPDGRYSIDIDRFSEAITDGTRLFLLCNPHNPVGRVLTSEELLPMAEACLRHDTIICSDEIHCDLVYSDHRHVPIASLAPEIEAHTITLMAPSKTFNIAGLHCGFAIIPNPDLRRAYNRARGALVGPPNLMGYVAAQAAYAGGQPWLEALLSYLQANRDFMLDYVAKFMSQLRVAAPEGTYLAWIDCSAADLPQSPKAFFLERGRIAFNDGTDFGPDGEGYLRLNFGCPRQLLVEGLERMRGALGTL